MARGTETEREGGWLKKTFFPFGAKRRLAESTAAVEGTE